MHASQRKKHYNTTVTTSRGKSTAVPRLALTYGLTPCSSTAETAGESNQG